MVVRIYCKIMLFRYLEFYRNYKLNCGVVSLVGLALKSGKTSWKDDPTLNVCGSQPHLVREYCALCR